MSDYPGAPVAVNHVEPVPRRIRAFVDGQPVVDTLQARYVWEVPYFPQYYVPAADVRMDLLVPEDTIQDSARGKVRLHALQVGDTYRPLAARVLQESTIEGLSETVRFDWASMDAWFEEDEEVFVHPRNPFSRCDTLRSTRHIRVELEGLVLAQSASPMMLFETGLPTRYYVDRTDVNFANLVPSDTVTACPYKGTTSAYWSATAGGEVHPDIAWAYDFPRRDVQPIAGLVAFYNEKVDIYVDGVALDR